MNPLETYKRYLPDSFETDANKEFFEWAEKTLKPLIDLHRSLDETAPLMALIQSGGPWLDMIGSWCRMQRPNVAVRPLGDGEVLLVDINNPPDPAFVKLHGLSDVNPTTPNDVTGTYLPSISQKLEDSMDDDNYKRLLIAYQNLKFNGDTMPRVIAVLEAMLADPFTMEQYTPGETIIFKASPTEPYQRILAAQELFESISFAGIIYTLIS